MEQLDEKPMVRKWMVDSLGALDMNTGFPVVKQMHSNPVKDPSKEKRFSNMLNNQAARTDAVVIVAEQAIHVHKLLINTRCRLLGHVLREQWTSNNNVATLHAQPAESIIYLTPQVSCSCSMSTPRKSSGQSTLQICCQLLSCLCSQPDTTCPISAVKQR